ncbi:5'-methylthioadenosine nucleosidase [Linum perenne]
MELSAVAVLRREMAIGLDMHSSFQLLINNADVVSLLSRSLVMISFLASDVSVMIRDQDCLTWHITSIVASILYFGATNAYVAEMLKVPVIFVKAVSDIVDSDKPTAVEFLQNLASVTAALDESVTRVVDFG